MKRNIETIAHMYTGLIVYEGKDCNPNGDPNKNGAPRTDPETGHGRTSPQSVTRRSVDRTYDVVGHLPGYDLQIQRGTSIEAGILAAAKKADIKPSKSLKPDERNQVTKSVCDKFFDTRMKGGVLSIGSCPTEGVNGVITFGWGRSIYPVSIQSDTLTRVSPTNEAQEKKQEMGCRYSIAHGVYRQPFFVNPRHAAKNGATLQDLAIFLDSLVNVYEHHRSVMSGMISMRGIWLFRHAHKFGNAPAHLLLDRIQIESDKGEMARSWDDYNLRFDAKDLPEGIKVFTLEDLLGGHEAVLAQLEG